MDLYRPYQLVRLHTNNNYGTGTSLIQSILQAAASPSFLVSFGNEFCCFVDLGAKLVWIFQLQCEGKDVRGLNYQFTANLSGSSRDYAEHDELVRREMFQRFEAASTYSIVLKLHNGFRQ